MSLARHDQASLEALYDRFRRSRGIATDTRTLQGGEMFFALKGERFDGNGYAAAALARGAACAVVDADRPAAALADDRIVPVRDPLATLKALAAWHRDHVRSALPVIGLTGTNGKTTTKELIRAVLARTLRVTATEGNLNNDIGVPLSVLRITPETEVAVIEMGASHPEDITALVAVCKPDAGLITNVGKAHLQGFGDFEGVKRAKGRLYDYLAAHGGTAFVNADDPVLMGMAAERGLAVEPYGGATVLPCTAEEPYLALRLPDGTRVRTRLVGAYNAPNVLAALAVGAHFGVPRAEALSAVAAYQPSNSRSQLVRTGRNTVIEDLYNANPTSMAAALDHFARIGAPSKVLLLGAMRELGPSSLEEHRKVIRAAAGLGAQVVGLVGEEFGEALREEPVAGVWYFPDSAALAEYLEAHPLRGCTVLVKGSRSVAMERVLPML